MYLRFSLKVQTHGVGNGIFESPFVFRKIVNTVGNFVTECWYFRGG